MNLLELSPLDHSGIFQASALIFFTFIGFEEIVKLSEEAKDSEQNIPRGLMRAISASIVLYIMLALSAASVLGWERLSRSSSPFADITYSALGPSASTIISIMALFATTNNPDPCLESRHPSIPAPKPPGQPRSCPWPLPCRSCF